MSTHARAEDVRPETRGAAGHRATRGTRLPDRFVRWAGPVILVFVAFVTVGLHVQSYTSLSPVDELTHIDSLFNAPHPVHSGEKVGERALREQACRGIIDNFSPACSTPAPLDPNAFQERGYNTGAVYTPLYYTMTKIIAVPLQLVTGMDSLVTAARLVGAVWMAAGLLLTYSVGRRLGAPRSSLTAILVVVAVTPSILFPSATVSPDATGLVSGAAVIWALLVWEGDLRRRWWVPVVVAGLVAALKTVNLVAVFMAACYVLVRLVTSWYAERQQAPLEGHLARRDRLPLVLGGAAVALMTLVVLAGWSVYTAATTVGSTSDAPMNSRTEVSSLSVWEIFVSMGQFLNPLDPAGNVNTTDIVGFVTQRLTGMLLMAGIIAGALFAIGSHRHRAFGQAALLAGALGGPLMTIFIFVLNGAYIAMPGRYAITLVPVAVVLTASFAKTRSVQVVLCALAAVAWIWTVATLI